VPGPSSLERKMSPAIVAPEGEFSSPVVFHSFLLTSARGISPIQLRNFPLPLPSPLEPLFVPSLLFAVASPGTGN